MEPIKIKDQLLTLSFTKMDNHTLLYHIVAVDKNLRATYLLDWLRGELALNQDQIFEVIDQLTGYNSMAYIYNNHVTCIYFNTREEAQLALLSLPSILTVAKLI